MSWRCLGTRNFASRLAAALRSQWPALVVLCVVAAGTIAVTASLHEAYKRDGWLRQHAFWHSVYISIQYHPEYSPYYAQLHEHAGGDEMPIAGIFLYLKSHPEKDTPDIYLAGKTLKASAMESLARAAFFSFVWQHPKFVFETFFIYKPKTFFHFLVQVLQSEWRNLEIRSGFLFVAMILTLGMLVGARMEPVHFGRACFLFCVMLLPSLAVPFLTVFFPAVMSEQVIAIQIAVMMLLALGVGFLVRSIKPYLGLETGLSHPGSQTACETALAVPSQARDAPLS